MPGQSSLLPTQEEQNRTVSERRAAIRYQCDREVSCSSPTPPERLSGRVRDISLHGIGLILATSIPHGTQVVVDLKTKNAGICLTLLARVMHSTPRSEEDWIVGCEFISQPTEEQLGSLL